MKKQTKAYVLSAALAIGHAMPLCAAVDWETFDGAFPAGEIVPVTTAAQVAKLQSVSLLTIPETTEVKVNYGTGFELATPITGAGKLTVLNCKDFSLSGESANFSGEIYSSNTMFTVKRRTALGSAKVTNYMGARWYIQGAFRFSTADAAGEYANDFHFIEDTAFDYHWLHGGRSVVSMVGSGLSVIFTGSLRFTGDVDTYCNSGSFEFRCPISHDGRSTTEFGGFATAGSNQNHTFGTSSLTGLEYDYGDGEGVIQIRCGSVYGGHFTCGKFVIAGSVPLWYANYMTFSPQASFQFGSDFINENQNRPFLYSGVVRWSGNASSVYSVSNLLYCSMIDASNVTSMDNKMVGDGTLRVTGCGPDFGWYCKYDEQMSIELDSQTEPAGSLVLKNAQSTTTGKLVAKRGTLSLGTGARFTSVSALEASGDGVIEIQDPAAVSADVPVKLASATSGTISVPTGVTAYVGTVTVGERKIRHGTFDSRYSPFFRVAGGGTLVVGDGSGNGLMLLFR